MLTYPRFLIIKKIEINKLITLGLGQIGIFFKCLYPSFREAQTSHHNLRRTSRIGIQMLLFLKS